ncbi:hypothetical protein CTheo_8839 [Ceratobasidium theobromae]|uniref:Uncharacterized protein n=1 Tax=Ceratobasidium theobromae TaxID=1582974 RepID=A0A5N5Q7Q4_9AGAM|nr:hypothetical protein CTheo_8839 [Ceratobasidium theobromae]
MIISVIPAWKNDLLCESIANRLVLFLQEILLENEQRAVRSDQPIVSVANQLAASQSLLQRVPRLGAEPLEDCIPAPHEPALPFYCPVRARPRFLLEDSVVLGHFVEIESDARRVWHVEWHRLVRVVSRIARAGGGALGPVADLSASEQKDFASE